MTKNTVVSEIAEREKSKKLHPVVVGLIALVAVVGIWDAFQHPPRLGANLAEKELRAEFPKILPPPSAAPTQPLKVFSKTGLVSVSRLYATRVPAETILKHYRQQLSDNGWGYRWGHQGRGATRWEDFCKGPYMATVEILADSTERQTNYDFSMGWSDISERECGQELKTN